MGTSCVCTRPWKRASTSRPWCVLRTLLRRIGAPNTLLGRWAFRFPRPTHPIRFPSARTASCTRQNENGETALHVAADAGRLEVVQFLLERGADANAQEPDQGQTPLTYAIMAEHADVAEALVRGGADPLQSDKEGSNPLAECSDEELHARLQAVFEEIHGEHQGAGEAKVDEA